AAAAALAASADDAHPGEASVAIHARRGLEALSVIGRGLAERVAPNEAWAPAFSAAAVRLAEMCRASLSDRMFSHPASVTSTAALPTHANETLRLSIRQQLFGREFLLDDDLPAGLLRLALIVTLTLAGARLRTEGEGTVQPGHLSTSHMIARRMLHRPEPHRLLIANADLAWCVLDALPWIAADWGSVREP